MKGNMKSNMKSDMENNMKSENEIANKSRNENENKSVNKIENKSGNENENKSGKKNERGTDVLHVQGRMTLGYGMIPKMIMQDRRLTAEAKCIYAYFCSFAGAGSTAFPGRNKILYDLQMSEARYYRHFNLLKECGYITVTQHVGKAHKFSHNIYTLVEMVPPKYQPHPQNEGTEKPYPHFPCTEKPCAENEGAKSNSPKSNSDKNNHAENQQSMSKSTSKSTSTSTSTSRARAAQPTETLTMTETSTETLTKTLTMTPSSTLTETPTRAFTEMPVMNPEIPTTTTTKMPATTPTKKELPSTPPAAQSIGTNKTDESPVKNPAHGITYEALEATVRQNIHYEDFLAERHPYIKLIDEIVHNMLDVLTSTAPYTRIKSREKETAVVKSVYMKLGYAHIVYVLERFRDVTYPIVHKGSYLKTLLYTSLEEMESYYENQYRTGAL